jgi:RimJ/RimL family protein N-acetyltransferase
VLFILYALHMIEQSKPEQVQPTNLHNIPELQTVPVRGGVILRPLGEDDAAQILGILDADPSIRERVSVASKLHTPEDVAKQVEIYRKDDHLIRYAIVENEEVIGLVSFWRDIDSPFGVPDNPDDYGFGYFLSPAKRGSGIVTDTVQRLMDVAVKNLRVNQFIAYCETDNTDSISVLTKLGFHLTDIELTEQNTGWVEYKYVKELSSSDTD